MSKPLSAKRTLSPTLTSINATVLVAPDCANRLFVWFPRLLGEYFILSGTYVAPCCTYNHQSMDEHLRVGGHGCPTSSALPEAQFPLRLLLLIFPRAKT